MSQLGQSLFLCFCLLISSAGQAEDDAQPRLPVWQVLEFEEKAFWATARSSLEVQAVPQEPALWELTVLNSVVDNSELIVQQLDPTTGRALGLTRLSRGKEQRMKAYKFTDEFVLRERRTPANGSTLPPEEWPVTSSEKIPYPLFDDEPTRPVITSPYILVLLAQQLQAQGGDKTLELLVHTDWNFYLVRLTSGNGIPVDVNYSIDGGQAIQGRHETRAVALQATLVEGREGGDDFSLFGLEGDVILFFDRTTGLPVQVRGTAPRIGSTDINLKSVRMRDSDR
jgi:hypothetical protein